MKEVNDSMEVICSGVAHGSQEIEQRDLPLESKGELSGEKFKVTSEYDMITNKLNRHIFQISK